MAATRRTLFRPIDRVYRLSVTGQTVEFWTAAHEVAGVASEHDASGAREPIIYYR
jgi:hypothetical protein